MRRSRPAVDAHPSPVNAVVDRRSGSPGQRGAAVRTVVLVVAVALHLATSIFYLAAGLVAPVCAVLLLWAAWTGLLWVLVRVWRRHAVLALLVPPVSIGLFLEALGGALGTGTFASPSHRALDLASAVGVDDLPVSRPAPGRTATRS